MKTKLLLKFLLLATVALVLSAQNLKAQESEPNNTPAQANTLAVNGNSFGTNDPIGDVDWWKVTTNADGRLYITMSNDGTRDLKQVVLYDGDGVTYLNNAFVGNGVGGLVQDGLAAGTYYLKIFNNDVNPEISGYTIKDSLAPTIYTNDREPNNTSKQAVHLNLNSSATGHIGFYYNNHRDTSDWFKITTSADGMLKITLDGSSNISNGLVYVNLFDNDGTTLLANAPVGQGIGGLNKDGLAAGTYYIQLKGEETFSTAYTSYILRDSLKTYKYKADAEPNTKPYQADSLPLNATATGHVNFYYNNKKDTTDWYLLRYTDTSAKLSLTVKIAPSLIDNSIHGIHLDFYKDTLNAPVITKAFFASSNTFKIAHGKYYVKVYSHDATTDFSAYSISNTTPPVNAVSDIMLNNSPVINSKFTWNISGSAATNNCSVQLSLNQNSNIAIRVVSLNGNPVQLINKDNLQKGSYTIPINLSNALPGIYVVNLIVDDKLYSKNILK
jgi:hypothetical protein